MNVKSIMAAHAQTIQADASIQEAARKMYKKNIGALPVYEGDILIGMLTDRDIVLRVIAKGLDPKHSKVEDAMTWNAGTCFENWDVEDAIKVMEDKKVRRLAVLNSGGAVVGVLSLTDIALKAHRTEWVEEFFEKLSSASRLENETYASYFRDEGYK